MTALPGVGQGFFDDRQPQTLFSLGATIEQPPSFREGTNTGFAVTTLGDLVRFDLSSPQSGASIVYSSDPVGFAQTELPAYRCPSDVGESQDRTSSVAVMGTTNYVGNFGVGLPLMEHEMGMMQGIFGCNSRTRIRDLRDGTTNTILAGERRLPRRGTAWPEGQIDGSFTSYWAGIPRGTHPLAIVGTATDGDITQESSDTGHLNASGDLNGYHSKPQQVRLISINRSIAGKSLPSTNEWRQSVSGGFSSYHPGGANVLIGDASVRFISDSVDPNKLINLMRRADYGPCCSY